MPLNFRTLLAMTLLAGCNNFPATGTPTRSVMAAWHPVHGYVVDVCATGAWLGEPNRRRTHAEVYEKAKTWPSTEAARAELRAADFNPDDFEYREVIVR